MLYYLSLRFSYSSTYAFVKDADDLSRENSLFGIFLPPRDPVNVWKRNNDGILRALCLSLGAEETFRRVRFLRASARGRDVAARKLDAYFGRIVSHARVLELVTRPFSFQRRGIFPLLLCTRTRCTLLVTSLSPRTRILGLSTAFARVSSEIVSLYPTQKCKTNPPGDICPALIYLENKKRISQ